MRKSPNLILLTVVGAVALVAVAAGVFSAVRGSPEYDRGTPEGVVQAYLSAVIDQDNAAAMDFLDEDGPCVISDLDNAWVPDGVRVVLRDTEVDSDAARVRIGVAASSGGLFAGEEFFEDHTFRLTRTGGNWLIEGAPWPMYECGRVD